ncbi:ketopantoate reductase family protein [Zwartia vadi]|uniref:ketopantoate reductase family protein n=1 Tax=Zwartia vadi TaxID=3058168 RepID=UPI0025B44414|nr:2-dehydropantoate 2-reductase [Zwartia vadi]MDN3986514.1 2-dehydropantoate 2-reductase [Zwartia vadi]
MKVCIYGAGAVGGHLGARLASAGQHEISVIARGPQLAAIKQRGLTVSRGDEVHTGSPQHATDDPRTLAPQDIVIVTLKAQALPDAAASIEGLLAPDGVAVFAINGIPWWWHKGLAVPQTPLFSLDPQGELWTRLKDRSLGCVIYSPNEVIEPGVIRSAPKDRWMLGEPDGSKSPRLDRVAEVFQSAGIRGLATTELRHEIWTKLLINCALNPVAALSRLPTPLMNKNPDIIALRKSIMLEVTDIALACGTDLRGKIDLDELCTPTKRSGSNRASMLQDVLAGRTLEHEAILGVAVAFAKDHGVSAPRCELMLGLMRGLAESMQQPAN